MNVSPLQNQSALPHYGCNRLADLSVQCHQVASQGSVWLETGLLLGINPSTTRERPRNGCSTCAVSSQLPRHPFTKSAFYESCTVSCALMKPAHRLCLFLTIILQSHPYRSPALGGGVVAIDRHFFQSLGAYDPGMLLWGAEEIELSIRVNKNFISLFIWL